MDRPQLKYATNADQALWDAYVYNHPQANLGHHYGWRHVIHKTYGHRSYYLLAYVQHAAGTEVVGVLPLVHLKHFIFGNKLVSIPFLDSGGVLADNAVVTQQLISEAIKLARKLGASSIELRHVAPPIDTAMTALPVEVQSTKVQMCLTLPASPTALMPSFKSKLRSQIKKPLKEGFTSTIGGLQLLDDFYQVFLVNMRDLGSPVHAKKLMYHVLDEFSEQAKVIAVYKGTEPVAASIVVGFKDVLYNPWASFVRKYAVLSPNMLLYLRMLEYACESHFKVFNFGRSTPEEGTYKFKQQWGAAPTPLYWYLISTNGEPIEPQSSKQDRFAKAIHYWKKLPVLVTRVIGPHIRKYISL